MSTILTNLHKAREVLASIPEVAFDLTAFRVDNNTCGTIACAAGHLSMDPYFAPFMQLQESVPYNRWILRVLPLGGSDWSVPWTYGSLDDYFGWAAFEQLFEKRNLGYSDHFHPTYTNEWADESNNEWADESNNGGVHPDVTDKALALWRIDQQIAEVTRLKD